MQVLRSGSAETTNINLAHTQECVYYDLRSIEKALKGRLSVRIDLTLSIWNYQIKINSARKENRL